MENVCYRLRWCSQSRGKRKLYFLGAVAAAAVSPWAQLWINLFLILKPKQKTARPSSIQPGGRLEKRKLRQNIFLMPEVYKNCCVVFMFYKLFHHSPSSTSRLQHNFMRWFSLCIWGSRVYLARASLLNRYKT